MDVNYPVGIFKTQQAMVEIILKDRGHLGVRKKIHIKYYISPFI